MKKTTVFFEIAKVIAFIIGIVAIFSVGFLFGKYNPLDFGQVMCGLTVAATGVFIIWRVNIRGDD
jgi:hypothetical protein